MRFICNLDVPRTADATGIPRSWTQDHTVSLEARGLLATLLSLAGEERVVDETMLGGVDHPDNPPLAEVVRELCRAGYLEWLARPPEGPLYALVHPARLGSLGAS